MERSDKIGVGVAVAGHAVLFGLLSVGLLSAPKPDVPKETPVDISLADDVALEQQAPPATEAPAQSTAPEPGPPEEAAPPAPAEPEPEPEPKPKPPVRQPEPAPAPKPVAKAPPKPDKKPVEKPEKAKAPPTKTAAPPAKVPAKTSGTGANPASPKREAGGFKLSAETLKGPATKPSETKSQTPVGATMNAQAAADIGSAIKRQVQPCADRQTNPGPGASRIVVTIRLQINRDGSLVGRPTITGHSGVDDENSRYVDAIDRNAIATFMGCAPLRGLPPELYDVPRGWKTFSLRYKLPG